MMVFSTTFPLQTVGANQSYSSFSVVLLPPLRASGLVIAMLVSMLFLLLLRFTAPVMVWVLIFGLLGAGAYGKLKEKDLHS